MDPRDLVNAILFRRERSASAFLKEHGLPKLQPTFSRWLNRNTRNPRKEWVDPIAKALGIKPGAMTDETVADEEAARLGIRALSVAEPAAAYAKRPRQTRIDAGTIAMQIGDLMRAYDQDLRESAAPLFKVAATQPERAAEMAERLRLLLSEPSEKRNGTDG